MTFHWTVFVLAELGGGGALLFPLKWLLFSLTFRRNRKINAKRAGIGDRARDGRADGEKIGERRKRGGRRGIDFSTLTSGKRMNVEEEREVARGGGFGEMRSRMRQERRRGRWEEGVAKGVSYHLLLPNDR